MYNKSTQWPSSKSPYHSEFFYLVYGWYLKNGAFDSLANTTITKKTQKHLGKRIFDWNLWYVGRWRQKKVKIANLVKVGQRNKKIYFWKKKPGGIRFRVLYTKNQLPRLKTVSRKMGESEKNLRCFFTKTGSSFQIK